RAGRADGAPAAACLEADGDPVEQIRRVGVPAERPALADRQEPARPRLREAVLAAGPRQPESGEVAGARDEGGRPGGDVRPGGGPTPTAIRPPPLRGTRSARRRPPRRRATRPLARAISFPVPPRGKATTDAGYWRLTRKWARRFRAQHSSVSSVQRGRSSP